MPFSNRSGSPVALAAGGLVALAAALGIGRFVYTPILPVMAEALHLSKSQAGLIASANLFGYLIGALLAATPWLPGSRRFWLLGSLGVSAVTTVTMGLVSSMPAFLALRFTGGAASAFVLVLASALVLDRLASAGRPQLAQVHFAGVGTGIAVSALIVSVSLVAGGAGWRTLWYIVGGVALARAGCCRMACAAGCSCAAIPACRHRFIAGAPRPGCTYLRVRPVRFRLHRYRDLPGSDRASITIDPRRGTCRLAGRRSDGCAVRDPLGESCLPPRHLTHLQSGLRR